ncbi:MAG: ABC transporter permease subunit [Candidatus Woesearchaeota archaeon]
MGAQLRNISTIFWDSFTESVKTKRALLLIVSYLLLMYLGIKAGSLLEVFSWALAGSRQSFSLLLPFYVSVIILPLFSIIVGYNMISDEISSGSIKFMAYRTDRFSIIAGKLLSSGFLVTLIVLIAYMASLVFIHSRTGLWFFLPYAISWIYLSIYAFSFTCLAIAVSSIARSPSSSILWSVLVCAVFLLIFNISYAKVISPFYFSNNALDFLIDGVFIDMLLGAIVLCLHSLIYSMIGYISIRKADLS